LLLLYLILRTPTSPSCSVDYYKDVSTNRSLLVTSVLSMRFYSFLSNCSYVISYFLPNFLYVQHFQFQFTSVFLVVFILLFVPVCPTADPGFNHEYRYMSLCL
jgi:hypothetical protein